MRRDMLTRPTEEDETNGEGVRGRRAFALGIVVSSFLLGGLVVHATIGGGADASKPPRTDGRGEGGRGGDEGGAEEGDEGVDEGGSDGGGGDESIEEGAFEGSDDEDEEQVTSLPPPEKAVRLLGVTKARARKLQARWRRFEDGSITWDHRVGRLITFTFDDGPSQVVTPLVLAKLNRYGIKGAFFVNGRRFGGHSAVASKNRQVVAQAAKQGHLIGNHTYTHPMMSAESADKQKWEVLATHRAIIGATGLRPFIYRPPFGGQTHYSRRLLERAGYSTVMWNLSSNDPFGRHVKKAHATVMNKIRRRGGGIVLMHDTNGWAACAVPLIVRSILIESCKLIHRGEEPYLIVGLEHFWVPEGGGVPRPSAEARAQAARWRAKVFRLCGKGAPTGGPQDRSQKSGLSQMWRAQRSRGHRM
jgi:peptidoglycan/xylan/chitin deacetylase (PgdA/CDA1 family)